MGAFSLVHWLVVIVIIAIVAFPLVKILHKAGYSGWWAILWFIPLVNLAVLWVFAFAKWPALGGRA